MTKYLTKHSTEDEWGGVELTEENTPHVALTADDNAVHYVEKIKTFEINYHYDTGELYKTKKVIANAEGYYLIKDDDMEGFNYLFYYNEEESIQYLVVPNYTKIFNNTDFNMSDEAYVGYLYYYNQEGTKLDENCPPIIVNGSFGTPNCPLEESMIPNYSNNGWTLTPNGDTLVTIGEHLGQNKLYFKPLS